MPRESLIALALWQHDKRAGSLRQFLYQYLLEVALSQRQQCLTKDELRVAMRELLEPRFRLDEDGFGRSLDACIEARHVVSTPDQLPLYVIAASRAEEIEKSQAEHKADEAEFNARVMVAVAASLRRELDDLAAQAILATVKEVAQDVLYHNAVGLQLAHKEGRLHEFLWEEMSGHWKQELSQRIGPIVTQYGLASASDVIRGIQDFLQEPSVRSQSYILSLYRRVLYHQILGSDPAVQNVILEAVKQTRVFLDTNVLLGYLFEGGEGHGVVREIVDACRSLCAVCVSPATLCEFEQQVEWAGRALVAWRTTAAQRFSTGRFHPIIATFLIQKRRQPALDGRAFMAPFEDAEGYLKHVGLSVETEGFNEVHDDARYNDVWRVIREVRYDLYGDNVVTHDAENFIFIHRLRAQHPETAMGASVWLLTRDTSLRTTERRLRSNFDVPHCRLIHEMGQWLLPARLESDAQAEMEGYAVYLVKSQLGAAVAEVQLNTRMLEVINNPSFQISQVLDLPDRLAIRIVSHLQNSADAQRLLLDLEGGDEEKRRQADQKLTAEAMDYMLGETVSREDENEVLRNYLTTVQTKLQTFAEERETRISEFKNLEKQLRDLEQAGEATRALPWWKRMWAAFTGRD